MALYSHDTQGLGHVRRNLAVSGALAASDPAPELLLISGAREARTFTLPPGADVVTLPALHKTVDGRYRPRTLRGPLEQTVALRSRIIEATLDAFRPDLLVVDKVPRGIAGELEPALRRLRRRRAVAVLGLRDVLDAPEAARGEWEAHGASEAIRQLYDRVWVYGDPTVYDLVSEYHIPHDVAVKTVHTGYLARRPRLRDVASRPSGLPDGPYALCLVGGGQDGGRLARRFLAASLPDGLGAAVVAGPYMPSGDRQRLHAQAAQRPRRVVLDFVSDCDALLAHATCVVSMGGYNTVCELLAHGVRALIAPRVVPRREQLVRAERLAGLGLVDLLNPDALTASAIGSWVSGRGVAHRHVDTSVVDLNGLATLPAVFAESLAAAGRSGEVARAAS